MHAVGTRYRLPHDTWAEVYDHGEIVLRRGTIQEFFGTDGFRVTTTDESVSLFAELGVPYNLLDYIKAHGRPYGTIRR